MTPEQKERKKYNTLAEPIRTFLDETGLKATDKNIDAILNLGVFFAACVRESIVDHIDDGFGTKDLILCDTDKLYNKTIWKQ